MKPMERIARIELAFSAWKADVLPLHHTRMLGYSRTVATINSYRSSGFPCPILCTRFPLGTVCWARTNTAGVKVPCATDYTKTAQAITPVGVDC